MVKLLIVDGVDCSGKTTIIEKISKDKFFRNSLIIKSNYRPSFGDSESIKTKYKEILLMINTIKDYDYIIMDRFFMSEIVYGIIRGYDKMYDEWYEKFEYNILTLDHLYVFVSPKFEIIEERYNIRKDEHIKDLKLLKTLYDRYIQFFEKTKLQKIWIESYNDLELIKNGIGK